MGTRAHAREGVAKASFSISDLLDERFDFDRAALARLREKAAGEPTLPTLAVR
jgi:hypothetical protein